MPRAHLHGGEHPLAVPPPARVELEHVLPFLHQERRVLAVAGAEEAEVLVEDGVPGGEPGGPGERDRLVLPLPGEVVEQEADQEADARDLDGVRAEQLRGPPGEGGASAAASAAGSDGAASAGVEDSSEEAASGTGMPSNSSSSQRSSVGVGFGGVSVGLGSGLGFGAEVVVVVVVTGGEGVEVEREMRGGGGSSTSSPSSSSSSAEAASAWAEWRSSEPKPSKWAARVREKDSASRRRTSAARGGRIELAVAMDGEVWTLEVGIILLFFFFFFFGWTRREDEGDVCYYSGGRLRFAKGER